MAPFAQHGGSDRSIAAPTTISLISTVKPTGATSTSYSTRDSTPTLVSSVTTISSPFATSTATPTYISKGSPTPTNTSLRGSQPPSKMAIQSTTLAFILVLTLLLGVALGILAWKKGWGYRNTVVVPSQQPKPPTLQRQDSNATLVDESSLRRHRRERTVTVETSELRLHGDGSVRHVEKSAVQFPKQAFYSGGVTAS